MVRRPPRDTLTNTLIPDTTRVRSWIGGRVFIGAGGDDALRGLDLRAPLVGAVALAQQGQGEHVRPGLIEQGADELGQALVADDRVERLRGAQLGDLELFLAARGLDVPAFEQFEIGRASCRERVCQYV